jgi:hypothetical protein
MNLTNIYIYLFSNDQWYGDMIARHVSGKQGHSDHNVIYLTSTKWNGD